MAALTFTLHNTSDTTLYVHNIQAIAKTPTGDSAGDAVSAVDFNRYFQAFPTLKEGAQPALSPEAKIPPGETVKGTVIVAFSVPMNTFVQHKSISVLIWPYSQTVPV